MAPQLMPKSNLLAVLKFAPVILIVLGIELNLYPIKLHLKHGKLKIEAEA